MNFVDDYLPALLAQASLLMSRDFHAVVTTHGLTVSDWIVLATLSGGEAISIGALAETTTLKQPTVTRILDRMAAKGQVERVEHPADRRSTLVRITPTGAEVANRLIPLARQHEASALAAYGGPEGEALKAALRGLIRAQRARSEDGAD